MAAALALAALIATFARPALVSAQAEGEAAFEVHLSDQGTGIFIKYWPAAIRLTVTFDDPATEESPDDQIEVVTGSTEEGYGGGGFIERLVGSPAVAGLVGAALVGGWDGTGPLLAGLLVGCVAVEVAYVVAMDEPVDVVETAQLFVICAVPLLVGYGIGRGLARLG